MAETPTCLECIPTDELLNELKRRSLLFFGIMKPKAQQDGKNWIRSVEGESLYELVGFVQVMLHDLLNDSTEVARLGDVQAE